MTEIQGDGCCSSSRIWKEMVEGSLDPAKWIFDAFTRSPRVAKVLSGG